MGLGQLHGANGGVISSIAADGDGSLELLFNVGDAGIVKAWLIQFS